MMKTHKSVSPALLVHLATVRPHHSACPQCSVLEVSPTSAGHVAASPTLFVVDAPAHDEQPNKITQ